MPPVWYRDIHPLGEPFDVGGINEAGHVECSVNFLVTKRPSDTFVQEVIALLVAADVGEAGVNIFGTSRAVIPVGDGPYLSVRPTGGTAPLGTHNDGVAAYRRPGLQLLVRAKTWPPAEAMARRAYDALIAVRNRELSA